MSQIHGRLGTAGHCWSQRHSHLLIYLFELNGEKGGAVGSGCFTPPAAFLAFGSSRPS